MRQCMAIHIFIFNIRNQSDEAEVKRVLKVSGKVAVIEFHKRVTPMGPMVEHRLGNNCLNKLFSEIGFISCDEFDLGENLYCIVFEKL